MSAWTTAVAALSTQPVLWWRNDATSTNTSNAQSNSGSSGSSDAGNTGTTISVSQSSLLIGDANASISFGGQSTCNTLNGVYCAQDATHLQPGSAYTMCALIKGTAWDATTGNQIITYADNTGNCAYALVVETGGLLHTFVQTTGASHLNLFSTTTLTTGKTYFVVSTWDGTTLRQYINGVKESNTTSCSALDYTDLGSGVNFCVGTITGGNYYSAFNGLIDEPMLFNYALSQAQITALYNASINFAFVPSGDTVAAKSRYNAEGFAVWNGRIQVGPANLNRPFQPPLEFQPHGRYNAEGWSFSSGVSINGPSPMQRIVPPFLDAGQQRRYSAENWLWVGTTRSGPSPQPIFYPLDPAIRARYNAEGWTFASGVRIAGPSPYVVIPSFDLVYAVATPRKNDGWAFTFVSPTKGPTPQALAVFLDAIVKARFNSEGWAVFSGRITVGPAPHWVPQPPDVSNKPRYNAEGWYSFFGNGIAGPQPGPGTKTIGLSDAASQFNEVPGVTKPSGSNGPIIVPFFRGF